MPKVVKPPQHKHKTVKEGAISPFEWNRIAAVYAKHDCMFTPVACELGWDYRRVQRLYHRGYPSRKLPPISEMLAKDGELLEAVRAGRIDLDAALPQSVQIVSTTPAAQAEEISQKATVIHEAEAARLRQMIKREEDAQKSRDDAVKARAEEAMLVSINRRNALALNGVTAQVLKGALALSQKIQTQLELEAASGKMTAAQMLALVRSAAAVARFNSESTMLAVKAERAVLGDPISADVTEDGGDGSLDVAVQWIERAVSAVNKARERGVLTSGSPAPVTGKH